MRDEGRKGPCDEQIGDCYHDLIFLILKKKISPLLHAMETVVSARINTVQPNDHSLENTTIKNSARVSSL